MGNEHFKRRFHVPHAPETPLIQAVLCISAVIFRAVQMAREDAEGGLLYRRNEYIRSIGVRYKLMLLERLGFRTTITTESPGQTCWLAKPIIENTTHPLMSQVKSFTFLPISITISSNSSSASMSVHDIIIRRANGTAER